MIKNELGRMEMYPLPPVSSAKLVIIGEFPNITELRMGEYFVSTGADTLRQTMHKNNINDEDCYFTVAVPYLMNKKNKTIPVSRYNRERNRIIQEIKQSGATTVMPLGTLATSLLMGLKSLKINKVLGNQLQIDELPGVTIIPNYHPALLLYSPGNYKVFAGVIEIVSRLVQGIMIDPGQVRWKWAEDEEALIHLRDQIAPLRYVSADLETSGLVRHDTDIWVFGIATNKNEVTVVSYEAITKYPERIHEILKAGPQWIWHHGKFDTSIWHWKKFMEATLDQDTIYMHYCLNETSGTHGLGTMATMSLGADEYKSKMNSEFNVITDEKAYQHYKQDLGERVAIDADYTLQLFYRLQTELDKDPELKGLYENILMPAANFLRRVEMNGAKVDVNHLNNMVPMYQQKLAEITEEIQEAAADYWDLETYKEQTGAKSGGVLFKPSSPKQLSWLVYDRLKLKVTNRKKAKARSTDVEALESIARPPEFVLKVLKFRNVNKEYSTYVKSYLKMKDSNDFVHTTFNLHITATGRLSSTEPNIQNVPVKNPELRASFIPRAKDRILMEVDYSGAELRVLAFVSQDKAMIKALEGDMHTETAINMFGTKFLEAEAVERKFLRGLAKTINFGIAYGRQATSISEKFGISMQEAQAYIDAWAVAYPQAWAYLQQCEVDVRAGKALRTLYGRTRRFGLIHQANIQNLVNEGKNFRIQSISSDNTLLAAMQMENTLKTVYDTFIINLIHDSILLDTPADPKVVAKVAKYATDTMIQLPKIRYNCNVPFKSDVDLGPNWGTFAAYDIETGTVEYHDERFKYEDWITHYGVDCSRKEISC